MKLRSLFFIVGLFLMSEVNAAEPGSYTGKITEILGGPGHGGITYISVDGTVKDLADGKPCAASRYSFAFDTANENSGLWVSMILTAYVAGKTVYLQGTGGCKGDAEWLNQVRLE